MKKKKKNKNLIRSVESSSTEMKVTDSDKVILSDFQSSLRLLKKKGRSKMRSTN